MNKKTAFILLLSVLLIRGVEGADWRLLTSTGAVNHYPGADGKVGTADDVVSDQPAHNSSASAPNTPGAFTYYIVDFPTGSSPAPEFGEDVIRFLTGTIQITTQPPSGTTLSFRIDGGTFTGTEAYTGGGPAAGSLASLGGQANGGAINLSTGEANVVFDATVTDQFSRVFAYTDLSFTATGREVTQSDFGKTGDAYIDQVLSPAAQAAGASVFLVVPFQFPLPADPTNPALSNAPIHGLFVAYSTATVPTTEQLIGAITGKTAPPSGADLNDDSAVDVADVVTYLYLAGH